jgi:ABC-2 type transport system permease protein
MNKIFLVARREFGVRVRKKSFFVLTLLAPLLMALLMTAPAIIMSLKDNDVKVVAVLDDTRSFDSTLVSTDLLKFQMLSSISLDSLRRTFSKAGYYAVLQIDTLNAKGEPSALRFYSGKQVSLEVQGDVRRLVEREVERRKLQAYQIPGIEKMVKDAHTSLSTSSIKWGERGEEQDTHVGVAMAISYAAAFLIYMFIFMFGSMVMRGVIEEKANRIVEVIVSSIKPFQLMMGKIFGIAAVGLLQFALWIVLTLLLIGILGSIIAPVALPQADVVAAAANSAPNMAANSSDIMHVLGYLSGFNFAWILTCFVLFFVGGYLLYSSMFAAIGSAVESEADTQQLMLPVTIPLILGIFVMLNTFQHPDRALSFWFSIIPFTSPVVMMARVPFEVPVWQVLLSLGLLYATFVGMVWLSAKIYRVGILMYGKKATFRELWKWVWFK